MILPDTLPPAAAGMVRVPSVPTPILASAFPSFSKALPPTEMEPSTGTFAVNPPSEALATAIISSPVFSTSTILSSLLTLIVSFASSLTPPDVSSRDAPDTLIEVLLPDVSYSISPMVTLSPAVGTVTSVIFVFLSSSTLISLPVSLLSPLSLYTFPSISTEPPSGTVAVILPSLSTTTVVSLSASPLMTVVLSPLTMLISPPAGIVAVNPPTFSVLSILTAPSPVFSTVSPLPT